MASCIGNIAGNIGLSCINPIEGGYTGRGVLIPMEAVPVLVIKSENPRVISDITLRDGAKVVAIDNEGSAPFDGSTTTGNNETGFVKFTKTLAVKMPERGAEFAAKVIEPLVKSGRGFIAVLEKIDRCGDGSFEVIGSTSPMKVVDPATVTRTDNSATGGAWSATLQSSEIYAECVLFETDYRTSLSIFEGLLAKAF